MFTEPIDAVKGMLYKVKLDAFEGPLDLLLFLIKKNELDIYDIPISLITGQFLEYIEIIQLLDLESASDFILMAATLMRIKAQMLLPKPEVEEEEEEIVDPRQELVTRLLEYKRFKDVAEDLAEHENYASQLYRRGSFKFEENGYTALQEEGSTASLFDLVAAFRKLLNERNKKFVVHRVEEVSVTVEERIAFISEKILEKSEIKFSTLFDERDPKMVWIVTFIAILEMTKRRMIRPIQNNAFEEILLVNLNG